MFRRLIGFIGGNRPNRRFPVRAALISPVDIGTIRPDAHYKWGRRTAPDYISCYVAMACGFSGAIRWSQVFGCRPVLVTALEYANGHAYCKHRVSPDERHPR